MPVPAFKRKPYEEQLTNIYAELTAEQRQAIIADLRRDAENLKNPIPYRAYCYELWGMALEEDEAALSKLRLAYMLKPTSLRLTKIGFRLLNLGKIEEALEKLAESADQAPRATTVAGISIAFSLCGAHAEALATYQDVVRLVVMDRHEDLLAAARSAAQLGLLAEAAEFTARLVALQQGFLLGDERAIDVLLACRELWEGQFAILPDLLSALHRYMALEEALHTPASNTEPPSDQVVNMLEATRPMRALAAAEYDGGRPS